MGLFSMIKKNSKLALKGGWGSAILVLLIIFGVSAVISIMHEVALSVLVDGAGLNDMIDMFIDNPGSRVTPEVFGMARIEFIVAAVMAVISLLLVSPLTLGSERWFFRLVHGERMHIAEMFHFFESGRNFGRSVWYYVNIFVRTMLWFIPFFAVPGTILGISVYFLSAGEEIPRSTSAIAGTGIFLAVILMILAAVFYAACVNRYALAPYLLAEGDGVTVRAAIRDSVRYTKGFRFSLFWFELSFIGWIFLCVILFPLMLYVAPYYNTALAMYSRYIIEKNRYAEPNATKEFLSTKDDSETIQIPPAREPEPPAESGDVPE